MLYILSFRRNHLIDQKSGIEKDAIKLMQELQETIVANEDLTVIGAEAFSNNDIILHNQQEKEPREDGMLLNSTSVENRVADSTSSDNNKIMREQETASTAPSTTVSSSSTFLDSNAGSQFASCLGGLFQYQLGTEQDDSRDPENSSSFNSTDEEDYQNLLASAESWRRRNGRQAERGGDVDLRTGRSGHLGALGYCASNHGHRNIGSFRISTHSGLTPNRRTRRDSRDQNDSWY